MHAGGGAGHRAQILLDDIQGRARLVLLPPAADDLPVLGSPAIPGAHRDDRPHLEASRPNARASVKPSATPSIDAASMTWLASLAAWPAREHEQVPPEALQDRADALDRLQVPAEHDQRSRLGAALAAANRRVDQRHALRPGAIGEVRHRGGIERAHDDDVQLRPMSAGEPLVAEEHRLDLGKGPNNADDDPVGGPRDLPAGARGLRTRRSASRTRSATVSNATTPSPPSPGWPSWGFPSLRGRRINDAPSLHVTLLRPLTAWPSDRLMTGQLPTQGLFVRKLTGYGQHRWRTGPLTTTRAVSSELHSSTRGGSRPRPLRPRHHGKRLADSSAVVRVSRAITASAALPRRAATRQESRRQRWRKIAGEAEDHGDNGGEVLRKVLAGIDRQIPISVGLILRSAPGS